MTRIRLLLPVLVLPLAAGCATTPQVEPQVVTMPQVNEQAEEQAIRDLVRRWDAAIAAKDLDAVAGMYMEDAVLMPPNAPLVRGRAAIRSGWSDMFQTPGFSLSVTPTTVDVAASGDMAEEVGTWRFSGETPQGPMSDEGKYVVVWKKVDGEWKVSSDIFNSDKPAAPPASAQAPVSTAHGMFNTADVTWSDAPPSLPRGLKVAVLEGDPAQPGPFTLRISAPAATTIPPHWHPGVEHVTVISGTFRIGQGETADWSSARTLRAGGFAYMPPKSPHFAQVTAGTVIQLHGTGPWAITYLNPADDPRNTTP